MTDCKFTISLSIVLEELEITVQLEDVVLLGVLGSGT